MNRSILTFFMGLGMADLAYGLWSGDKISVMIGVVIIVVTLSIINKNKEEKKNSTSEKESKGKK
ncbi:MAG: hypothetical protein U9N37_03240 [Thermodesulfobacteriota bacterium]|nr:hypothetical protein [Thermodesulfobacteriota bacterium]